MPVTSWIVVGQHVLKEFNLLTIVYFAVGNGVYTILMLMALACATVRNRGQAYLGLEELRDSGALPPLTVIIPAHNEAGSILETLRSVQQADYPNARIVIVDDGSSDSMLQKLTSTLGLEPKDLIYRPALPTQPVRRFWMSPRFPNLQVISKEHGGKPDALNTGINACRTPYFCTLDADSLIEPDALLRLMRPIIRSYRPVSVSGGVIRVRNGCEVEQGRVAKAMLAHSWLERLQVVEYLRSFLFGRAGWNLLGGTLIVSGAMAVFHRQLVVDAGGFSGATVGEDMEIVVRLQRDARRREKPTRVAFDFDPVCWTQCPSSFSMLARQRRRWQLGLCQTLWMNWKMMFNPRYGVLGLVSYPFHVWIECLGAVVEFLGYLVVPVAFALHLALPAFYIPLVMLSLVYAAFLSVGAILLEEITYRRYPRRRDLYLLLLGALVDNFGFRQLVLFYRVQGVALFIAGFNRWEKVSHGASTEA
jgi:cellulose synthase/poly-beta-1,6-N-acetylglucosamine synthase-like glycosyltransferase